MDNVCRRYFYFKTNFKNRAFLKKRRDKKRKTKYNI